MSKPPPPPRCFSFTASRNRCLKLSFSGAGLRTLTTDIGDGTRIHCWVPKTPNPARKNLVLIHGFGANAMWHFCEAIRYLSARFNVYVPDLLFFGKSYTAQPDRSESFQARCLMAAMQANAVERMSLVGLSYGGFVAYRMAAYFPSAVEKVVLCCAGVCLEERDLGSGLFVVDTIEEAASLLMPATAEKLKQLLKYTFFKFPRTIPRFLLEDFIDEMCVQNVEEKRKMLQCVVEGKKLSELPKISQPALIVWGDKDQVFPLELAHRLKRHLGDTAELTVIKNTGHGFIFEKPKEFNRRATAFLLNPQPPSPPAAEAAGTTS